jgi:hypothetical protein
MTTGRSRTLGELTVPPSLPVAEFDTVNELVSERSSGDTALRAAFASAWSGQVYRWRAALEHSAAFSRSIAAASGPPPDERYQQDHDLFTFFACALSAIECFHFAAYCIGALVNREKFALANPDNLRVFPANVRDSFVAAFPGEMLSSAMWSCLASPEYAIVRDLRNVLSHRGTPPRQHFLSAGGPDIPSAIPSNLADLATEWRYDFSLGAGCVEPYTTWLEHWISTLIMAAADFTAARIRRDGNAHA